MKYLIKYYNKIKVVELFEILLIVIIMITYKTLKGIIIMCHKFCKLIINNEKQSNIKNQTQDKFNVYFDN